MVNAMTSKKKKRKPYKIKSNKYTETADPQQQGRSNKKARKPTQRREQEANHKEEGRGGGRGGDSKNEIKRDLRASNT